MTTPTIEEMTAERLRMELEEQWERAHEDTLIRFSDWLVELILGERKRLASALEQLRQADILLGKAHFWMRDSASRSMVRLCNDINAFRGMTPPPAPEVK